jgi:hypothetical protein
VTALMSAELVAVLWLKGVPGIDATKVATMLPRDVTAWSSTGFVQVGAVLSDSAAPESRVRTAGISVHLWAVNQDSGKPPWGKAANLGELIVAGCEAPGQQRAVTKTGYAPVRVMDAEATGPRRLPGDEGAYAHYQLDLTLMWSATS